MPSKQKAALLSDHNNKTVYEISRPKDANQGTKHNYFGASGKTMLKLKTKRFAKI
jgi:hypothetical protein